MSDFDGIESVSSSSRLPRIEDGEYVLEVLSNKKQAGRKGGFFFIDEFKVVSSIGPKANAPGSLCSTVMDKSWDTTMGNKKHFVSALINTSERNVTAKDCDELYSDAQPGRGVRVKLIAYQQPKAKSEGTFTKLRFEPYIPEATASATPSPVAATTTSTVDI